MNANMSLMMSVMQNYDPKEQVYSGDSAQGEKWARLFNEGKTLFTQKCLTCHGGSANGQGPYARNVVTRPANLYERLSKYPDPDAPFHFWRVQEGVPGTAMPPWGRSLDAETIFKITTYEMSFTKGALRTVSGDVSDAEGDKFNADTGITPPISGTEEQFQMGKDLYQLYCQQCHGTNGQGDGPASIASPRGYIHPKPANFEESGADFNNYGRYVWKVREGVETTNMPIWKFLLSDDEMYQIIFYIQGFSKAEDYKSKWAPLYSDEFAQNLKR
jgi:cytochrome c oxidase cbb3-type subunit I/II